jgi:hypothetical protein
MNEEMSSLSGKSNVILLAVKQVSHHFEPSQIYSRWVRFCKKKFSGLGEIFLTGMTVAGFYG